MESMDIYQILEHLPHRYPFLLVDRVLEIESGRYLKAVKNVSYNEPYFTGHFPNRAIMPGVLILEALAQATGILAFVTSQSKPNERSNYLLVGIDNARFKRQVIPGDQLILEVEYQKTKRGIWKFDVEASVEGKMVASGEILCAEGRVE